MPYEPCDVEEIAKKLSVVTDELRSELEATELVLGAVGLGVAAEVDLEPTVTNGLRLGYSKVGSDWRLYIWKPGVDEKKHIGKCSRRQRVLAAERLEDLFDALMSSSQENVAAVERAVETTRAFNERIRALIKDD